MQTPVASHEQNSPAAKAGWLSPYRVLDLTDHRGTLAGQMLAKLGADVMQVEPPAGSPARHLAPFATDAEGKLHSLFWSAYCAGKRGITCDLDVDEGQALLRRLVASADFLIESEDPQVMSRRGLDFATLRELNPALIHVSITAFGFDGPKAGWAATDLTQWASGGPLLPTREPGQTPLRVAVPQAYLHAGADAACGAMVAHFARLKDGLGQHVDISVQQSAAQSTLASILSAAVGHKDFSIRPDARNAKKVLDLSGSGARTRRSKWRVKDGLVEMHLAMGPASGRFTNNLFAWLKEAGASSAEFTEWDWVTLPQRIESGEIDDSEMETVRAQVAAFVATRTKRKLMEEALRRKILMAPIMTVEDIARSPHHAARGFFETVVQDGMELQLPGPFAFAMNPVSVQPFVDVRPAPAIGQDNGSVYAELCGLSSDQLAALAAKGVI
jgi:crotonobetainyl-CoA:carnitine CoA-transferase CaiB-like acyl-CoA transferase